MRALLRKDIPWIWTDDMEKEFSSMKTLLCSPTYVKAFDPSLEGECYVDVAKVAGVGYIYVQIPKNRPKSGPGSQRVNVIRCGSTAGKASWKNFSILEFA